MKKIGSGIALSLLIVSIIVLIIIPAPGFVLDFFLALNISISLSILIITVFINEPLEFSVFPSVLLIMTLFRLALNIRTTFGILAKGYAGNVIEAFGEFVIGGNAIVGFIIFVIIVIVQFLVITKGSERVSEVAARFTLDAMPGKQMAIDADLNSGLISESEAKQRRITIQHESDFYGAMDGASKFVKGDAIAGIIITVINILAGFLIGSVQGGLSLAEALSKYTLLTVGDGLVSQLPALMISVGTGIVVTRAASETNLGSDVTKQFFARHFIFYIVGIVLLLLGLVTPLPAVPFVTIASLALVMGYVSSQKKEEDEQQEAEEEAPEDADDIRKPESILPLLQMEAIELEFGYGIIPLAEPSQGGDLFDRLIMTRRQVALELGFVVPIIRLRDNIQLESNQYLIKIRGNDAATGNIMFDHYLAMAAGEVDGDIEGTETIEPAFGLPAKWILAENREKAEIMGYTVVDPSSVISTHLTEVIKRNAYEILTREDVKQLVDNIKETNATLVEELIPSQMSLGDIQKVLSNLLKEMVSIRNLVKILEALADFSKSTADINILTEYTRQRLIKQLSRQYFPFGEANVVTFSPTLENHCLESIESGDLGSYMALEPSVEGRLIAGIVEEIRKLLQLGEQPIVVTAPIVRFYIKRLMESTIPELVVLSYNEIEPEVKIKTVGVVDFEI